MNDPTRQRIEELFHRALELKPEERAAMLDRECASDHLVRERVGRLLRHAGPGLDAALDQPVFSLPGSAPGTPAGNPERIGRYRVVRPIGEGGMGSVYEARQDNPQRTVALKLIRSGLATRGALKRFQQEGEVLGRLNHPGIAQIYEAGVVDRQGRLVDGASGAVDHVDGQPFLAMELIHGVPIDRYADTKNLGARERLQLLALVADAVEHAHRQGVVHRDLKPGNVLVDEVNGVARPRVLDFGVAHVADAEAMGATLRTGAGELIGTLAYMSPEQATGEIGAIDERADVYSLGVMAFQLLTGRLPLDLSRCAIPEAARLIREEEPSRLGAINTLFRGDIETIVAKALEKDAARRYQSAGALASDIRRFLRDEPIVARPAGTLYQLRKFARRNRGLVGGVATAFAALGVGLVGTAYLAVKEREQRRVAVLKTAESDRRAYRAGIAAAQAALEQDDVALASSSLRAAPEALRGWEWRHLMARAASTVQRVTLRGITPGQFLACISDDGAVVAAAQDGVLRFWDATTGDVIRSVPIAPGPCSTVTLSPDASRALIGRADGSIEMCDAGTGAVLWRFTDRQRSTWPASLSPDGGLVALGVQSDSAVAILNASTGDLVRTLPISSLLPPPLFSDDSRRVAITSATNDCSATLYDLSASRVLWEQPARGFVAMGADGRRGVLIERGRHRGRISTVDADNGRILESFELPDIGANYDAALRPDGAVMALHGLRRGIQLRDTATLAPVTSLDPGPGRVWFRYTSDGSRLASVTAGGVVSHWDGHIGPMPLVVPVFHPVHDASFTPDHARVAVGDWGSVSMWDAHTGELEWMRSLSIVGVQAVAVSPDAGRVAADAGRGSIAVLDASTGRVISTTAPDRREITALAWSRELGLLVVALADGGVECRDGANPGVRTAVLTPAQRPVGRLVMSPDGSSVVGMPGDGAAVLWTLGAATEPRVLSLPGGSVRNAAFSQDGRRLALAGAGPGIQLIEPATGRVAATLAVSAGAGVETLALSKDGERLAAACADQTIHFWDLRSGDEVAVVHADGTVNLAFDAARDSLMAVGPQGFTVFETTHAAADLLRKREHVSQARALIRPLLEKGGPRELRVAERVAEALRMEAYATPGTIDAALAMLLARGDHAATLNSDAWALVLPRESPRDRYEAGYALARGAAGILPENVSVLNTLATSEVRTDRFADAVVTLRRCTELRAKSGDPPHPADLALLAIALNALGQAPQAREALAESRRRSGDPQFRDDQTTTGIVLEAAERLR